MAAKKTPTEQTLAQLAYLASALSLEPPMNRVG